MLQQTFEVRSPKRAPALERRKRWEQAHHLRLAISDISVLVIVLGGGAVALGNDLHALFMGAVSMVLLSGMHTRGADVLGSGIAEYRRVAHASVLTLGVFATCGILLDWGGMRAALFIVGPIATVGLMLTRFLWRRWLLRQRRKLQYVSRTLVVGLEDDVRYVIASLQTGGENGYHVIGVTLFDDGASTPSRPAWLNVGELRIPIGGDIDSVHDTTAAIEADCIIVASSPPGRPDFVKRLSWQLEGMAAELVLSHRVTDVVGPRVSFKPVDSLPLLQISIPSYEGGKHLFKRMLDLCVAVIALIPIALMLPVIAVLVKADSRGPLFYRQERLGRDGRRFNMLKFRTMRVGADAELEKLQALNEGAGPLFKMRADPRVTRVGRVLRKLSLDELPQFWNVLVGDMSVVGPRPPLPAEVERYDGAATRRLYIKPGITGLWQVSGRSNLSWEESVRLDLRYVKNWSLLQDLQIMWRTAKVMIHPVGAY